MKTAIASTILALSAAAWGQQAQTPKCDKYQHLEPDYSARVAPVCADCFVTIPSRCVDDMHVLTEREWQDVLMRIKELESQKIEYFDAAGHDLGQLPPFTSLVAGPVTIDLKTGDVTIQNGVAVDDASRQFYDALAKQFQLQAGKRAKR